KLMDRIRVPSLSSREPGMWAFERPFRVGAGAYELGVIVQDSIQRVCSSSWRFEARIGPEAGLSAEAVQRDTIQAQDAHRVYQPPPTQTIGSSGRLRVKLIVNFAPQDQQRATLGPEDVQGLLAIIRKIAYDSRIGSYSVLACSVQTQRIFYRHEPAG